MKKPDEHKAHDTLIDALTGLFILGGVIVGIALLVELVRWLFSY